MLPWPQILNPEPDMQVTLKQNVELSFVCTTKLNGSTKIRNKQCIRWQQIYHLQPNFLSINPKFPTQLTTKQNVDQNMGNDENLWLLTDDFSDNPSDDKTRVVTARKRQIEKKHIKY